ncbi:hypothetical protein DW322_08805 [Rhodococcus rhodnii]|uniref:Capsid maturation protease n=2 Tax=Rhodococcus rhodnii TaxID=38312 RepID=R7WRF7_9NOCA|nr:hypothetical protein [Rhodococcus rhodnii]EOM77912.1 hypothetical protein Rrhod_0721 [Rhodococcus rhodnii LMG 5362]TXG90304.1 hypothetical protein DW322_08805 [Rhodococcus rhodnii]
MATLAQQREILAELQRLGAVDLAVLWRQAEAFDDFRGFMMDAFPELAAQYGIGAAELAAVWYEDAAPGLDYIAQPATLPPGEKWSQSTQWALNTSSGAAALEKLAGTLQRGIWDMARQTTIDNAASEPGATWARHASANACEFCRLMATRGAVYSSEAAATRVVGRGREMTVADRRARARGQTRVNGRTARGGIRARGGQSLGDKYHDHCHCIAVPVRPGGSYQPPAYVEQWRDEYRAATRATRGEGAIDVKAVLAEMRKNTP